MMTNNQATGHRLLAHVLLGAALLGAAGLSWAAEEKKPTVSAALQKPLLEIQELLKANKFPEAIDKLHAADGLAGKSPYDQHIINYDYLIACKGTNDLPCMAKALQGMIDDGFTPAEDSQKYTRYVAQMKYQEKNYDAAIDYGNRAVKGGFATDDTYQIVGASYYLKPDYKAAVQFEEAHLADVVKAGLTPKAEDLSIYLSACAQLKDEACEARALKYEVTYYPKPENWYQLLSLVRQQANGDIETLQTYRLMLAVGAMKTPDDYIEMAQTALHIGSPGDAVHALQTGLDKGVLSGPKQQQAQHLLTEAKQAAAADQPALAKTEHDADAASTGAKNAGVGLGYLGYQQYDKAAEQLAKAVAKGGLKNEADTRLLLGIAQLNAGHKDEALKTFGDVKGAPVLEQLAALWAIHARQS